MDAKRRILTTILILLVAIGVSISQETMPCESDHATWDTGERLTYKVYYNWQFIWIPAGEVDFTVTESADYYHMDVSGSTYKSYDPFFKVRDSYRSVVDKETDLPVYFVRDVLEGNYVRYDSISFDYEQGKINEYFGKSKETAEHFQYEMNGCTQDMVSILYFLRNTAPDRIATGNNLPINVFFDKEYFDLDIHVLDIYTKRIKGVGKHEVIQLTPQIVTDNVFLEGNEMNIYVCNDESKIPLLIESAVTVGSVKAVLIDTEKTRTNPFKS